MTTLENAQLIRRLAWRVYVVGSFLAVAVWLLVYSGDPEHILIVSLPIWIAWAIAAPGKRMEKMAQQSDVGRQMRQP